MSWALQKGLARREPRLLGMALEPGRDLLGGQGLVVKKAWHQPPGGDPASGPRRGRPLGTDDLTVTAQGGLSPQEHPATPP